MRTHKEIDQEYLNTCAMIGHKQHQVELAKSQITKLQTEIGNHQTRLFQLNKEALEAKDGEKTGVSEEQIPQSAGEAVPDQKDADEVRGGPAGN